MPVHSPRILNDVLLQRASGTKAHERQYTFLDESDGADASLSALELHERARRIAAVLQQGGAEGQRVLLLYPPGLDYVAGFFGCLYAGAIAVPAYPPDPVRLERTLPRLRAIIQDAEATWVLTTSGILSLADFVFEQAPDFRALQWLATDALPAGGAPAWREPDVGPDSLAFLQYTSGSTGAPKGVMLSHANLLHNLGLIARAFQVRDDSAGVIWLPPYHDMGLIGGILQPLYAGFPVTLMSPMSFLQRPMRWLEAVSHSRGTISGGPNFAFELCARRVTADEVKALDLSAWEVAFTGAEPIRAATLDRFAEVFAPAGFRREAFYPCYGLAEGTLIVSGEEKGRVPRVHVLEDAALTRGRAVRAEPGAAGARAHVGCGTTWAEQRLLVVDPESRVPCAPGHVGEIWVSGASIARGYWRKPGQSVETFQAVPVGAEDGPRYLRTGDLGLLLEDGQLIVTGRRKDLIILRGRNLYPQDVEAVVERAHPRVRPGGVAAFSVEIAGGEALAVVAEVGRELAVAADLAALEAVADTLRQAIARELEVQPHTLALLPPGAVPKTSSGKLQRFACRAALVSGELPVLWRHGDALPQAAMSAPPELRPGADSPASAAGLEQALREELVAVLGPEAAHRDASAPLTLLGLDSLAAADLQGRIEKRLGMRVSAATLLQDSSLEGLAKSLASTGTAGAPALPPLRRRQEGAGAPPASFAQQRLWFIQQLEPASTAYHIPLALSLRGPLDVPVMERALAELVRRHEVLRTTFTSHHGELVQHVHAPAPVPLPHVDLTNHPPEARQSLLDAQAGLDGRQPMDMTTGPLLRCTLLRFAPDDHVLLASVHHLVADGWSVGLLVRELAALHAAFAEGRPSPLPEPEFQYADFAAWQRAHLTPKALGKELAWWRQALVEAPSLLALPTDRPRPPRLSFHGARRSRLLPAALMTKLHALGRHEGATPFMCVVSALSTVLHRWSGQSDFVLGSVLSGRDVPGIRALVGDCTNFVPLRVRLPAEATVTGLLATVKASTLGALTHGHCPFDHVLAAVAPGSQRRELYNIVFVLDDYDIPHGMSAGGGLLVDVSLLDNRTTELDLTFEAAHGPDGLLIGCKYATDLFDAETVDRLLGHLEVVIGGMVEAPSRRLTELPLMPEAERHQVLHAWNPHVDAPRDGTLVERFEAQVDRTPDAIAVTFESRHLTYRELDSRANRLAHVLLRHGVGPDVLVGVCLERSLDLVVTLLGILKAGGAYLPIDPSYPREQLAFMLEDAQAPVLVTQSSLEDRVPASGDAALVRIDAVLAAANSASAPRPPRCNAPTDLAYVIYTSGSTGRPKGCMVQHDNVVRLFTATDAWFHFGPEDVWTLFHSYAFDFSVWELWGALLYGGRLVVVPYWVSRSPEAFHQLLADEAVTVLNQTPTAFRQLLHAEQQAAARDKVPSLALRYVIFGGEALDLAALRPWFERHGDARPTLVNMYGITETTVHVTYRPVRLADLERPGSSVIGCPIPDLQIYLLDPDGQPVPVGVPGEIHVGGAGVARGYLRRPELTAARFVDDHFGPVPGRKLYRAGDLARRLPTGDLEYLGRVDFQVKVRGFRIELGEVESALRRHPAVAEATAAVREDVPGDKRLVAYVTPGDVDTGALREHLRRHLPEYMVPSALVALESLPLSPNGKVDRRALPVAEAPRKEAPKMGALPLLQQQLVRLFGEVLHLERVGPHDDFFELGGHSLLATQLVTRVRAQLGVELPLRTLFEAPTVAQLAKHCEALMLHASRTDMPPLLPVSREEALPLSFAQQRLWFLEQLQPGQAVYNVPVALKLSGPLDVDVLRSTFAEVVRRHEVLRTTFALHADQPVQHIHPAPARHALPVEDLRALDASARDAALRERMTEEAHHPFNLTTGPLLRTVLVRTGETEHMLLLCMHHIVSDGWSMGVLVHEVAALYTTLQEGRPASLPELPVQYADFATWQRQWAQSEGLQAQLESLKSRLQGVPALELPAESGRPSTRTLRGASHFFTLPEERVHALEKVGRAQGATLFMVLLAAYQALLSRYSGQDDFAIGSPIAHRTRSELEPLIGFFVNTLVLRTRLEDDPTFAQLVDRVRESALAAYVHQDVPLDRLVEALGVERTEGRAPLFQVMFALQNAPMQPPSLPGIQVDILRSVTDTARFDLSLSLMERGGALEGALEYSLDLFSSATAERLARHFRALLEAVVRDAQVRVSRLPLMDEAERNQVLVTWNATHTGAPVAESIPSLFAAHVRRAPGAAAVEHEGRTLTYGELDARSNQLAKHLLSLGLKPEARVNPVLIPSTPSMRPRSRLWFPMVRLP